MFRWLILLVLWSIVNTLLLTETHVVVDVSVFPKEAAAGVPQPDSPQGLLRAFAALKPCFVIPQRSWHAWRSRRASRSRVPASWLKNVVQSLILSPLRDVARPPFLSLSFVTRCREPYYALSCCS